MSTPSPKTNYRGAEIRFGIRPRLILLNAGLSALAVISVAFLANQRSTSALREQALSGLNTTSQSLAQNVSAYFEAQRNDIATQASSPVISTAISSLSAARLELIEELSNNGYKLTPEELARVRAANRKYYEEVLVGALTKVRPTQPSVDSFLHPDPEAALLQYVYTVANPAPVGSKNNLKLPSEIAANEQLPAALRTAFPRTTYSALHTDVHAYLDALKTRTGYYDTFLVNNEGFVVYTTFKELDFQGNLRTGPERDTGLGQAYAAAANSGTPSGDVKNVVITDFAPYAKSYDAPASFIAAPVFSANDERLGVIIYQLPIDRVDRAATFDGRQQDAGLGKSGESYLVGQDFKARTNSRFIADLKDGVGRRSFVDTDAKTVKQTSIGTLTVDTIGTRAAFQGAGSDGYPDYRGTPVLGAYRSIDVLGRRFAVIAEIDTAEALAPAAALTRAILILGGVALAVVVLLSILFANRIARPIVALADTARRIASGDDAARAPTGSGDEIGQTAEQFNQMIEATLQARADAEHESMLLAGDITKLARTADSLSAGTREARAPQMNKPEVQQFALQFNAMIDSRNSAEDRIVQENRLLQTGIQDLLVSVADASDGDFTVRVKVTEGALGNVGDAVNLMLENIGDLIKDVQGSANRVAASALEIQASAEQLSTGASKQGAEIVNTTSAVQEMAANIESVSGNAAAASESASRARQAAEEGARAVQAVIAGMERISQNVQSGAKKIKRLGERSMEISSIVNVINQISAQTDMLALNAAIEAARAGEHGRGFTVVAEEVRKLAERAAGATKEIEKLVASIQAETNESVTTMEQQTVQVNEGSATVSAAGASLARIREASVQSAELVNEISLAAKQQVRGANGVVDAMQTVSQIAQQAQSGAAQTKRATESLATLANDLLTSASKFKV
jgi:methyl-accepting chemotaxis protein